MIKFGDNHIIVGYIKQLLTSFNLPNVPVFKEGMIPAEGKCYLKDDYFQQYKNGEWVSLFRYIEGVKYTNYTTNLSSETIDYDSKTHEYLGRYLRYLRDYKGLDLMQLYNCYSNKTVKKMDLRTLSESIVLPNIEELRKIITSDSSIKVISIPVNLNQVYTISLDCGLPVEMFCGFEGAYFDGDVLNEVNQKLWSQTYVKANYCSFNTPFLFEKLKNISSDIYNQVAAKECILKLFIKLPYLNNSSIVVLEGDYTGQNDFYIKSDDIYSCISSDVIFNAEMTDSQFKNFDLTQLNSKAQLLYLNTHISYPFATRLIEYLTDAVICKTETIGDNIKRLQSNLEWRRKEGLPAGINYKTEYSPYGVWSDRYKPILYNLIKINNLDDTYFDLLANVDKDVEQKLGKEIDIYKED